MEMRILLVEDDRDVAMTIERALVDRYDVVVAPGLSDAMERLRAGPRPDVIVSELTLHAGPPVSRLLEERERTPELAEVPVVILSAWSKAAETVAVHGIPAEHVLAKPLDLRRLEALIDGLAATRILRAAPPRRMPIPSDLHRTGAGY